MVIVSYPTSLPIKHKSFNCRLTQAIILSTNLKLIQPVWSTAVTSSAHYLENTPSGYLLGSIKNCSTRP